jgi:choice-of-anchor C domain-containing protein
MRTRRFIEYAIGLVLVMALCVPTLSHAKLLTNGSFEVGPAIPSGQSYVTVSGSSTAITGWTVTGSTIDVIEPGWAVSDGTRAIDLDGAFSIGGIQQTFATIAGATYIVSFDLSGNPDGAPQIKQVRVSVGEQQHDFSFDTTGQTRSTLIWQPTSFSFTAPGTSATLSFQSLSPAGNSWGGNVKCFVSGRRGWALPGLSFRE